MTRFEIEKINNGWILHTEFALEHIDVYYNTLDEVMKAIENFRQEWGIERRMIGEKSIGFDT